MADKKQVQDAGSEAVIAKAKDFWEKYNKPLMIASIVIILAVGGWYVYQNFFQKPKESKASEAMFMAEKYYSLDSVTKALNGDGQHPGFLKILSKYGGTKAAKLANFYVGSLYIKLNDNEKALKYLKKFSSSSKPVQARAYKLIGDVYGDLGKNSDALSYYKKAARHFETDEKNSADYLFMAAYFADRVMKDTKQATELYKELRQKFPNTLPGKDADNYLAQLGVYSVEN